MYQHMYQNNITTCLKGQSFYDKLEPKSNLNGSQMNIQDQFQAFDTVPVGIGHNIRRPQLPFVAQRQPAGNGHGGDF